MHDRAPGHCVLSHHTAAGTLVAPIFPVPRSSCPGRDPLQYDLRVPSVERLEPRLCFAIQNGGFEAVPDFADYQMTGNGAIRGGNFYVPVPEGEVQGILLNGPHAIAQGAPVSAAALETFLGVAAGTLSALGP